MNFKKMLKRARARFSENLPRDTEAMERFACQVLDVYDLPTNADYKRAVVKAIHGLSQSTHRAPKYFFYSHMARFEVMRAAVQKVTDMEKEAKQAATPKPESPPEPQVQDQRVQS